MSPGGPVRSRPGEADGPVDSHADAEIPELVRRGRVDESPAVGTELEALAELATEDETTVAVESVDSRAVVRAELEEEDGFVVGEIAFAGPTGRCRRSPWTPAMPALWEPGGRTTTGTATDKEVR